MLKPSPRPSPNGRESSVIGKSADKSARSKCYPLPLARYPGRARIEISLREVLTWILR